MSLTFEELVEASKRYDAMRERMKKLIGFDPTVGDHYGRIHLYNHVISENTPDEDILDLHSAYVAWKNEVLAFFEERDCHFDGDEFGELFFYDPMYGDIRFLGKYLDIYAGIDPHRERMLEVIEEKKKK